MYVLTSYVSLARARGRARRRARTRAYARAREDPILGVRIWPHPEMVQKWVKYHIILPKSIVNRHLTGPKSGPKVAKMTHFGYP